MKRSDNKNRRFQIKRILPVLFVFLIIIFLTIQSPEDTMSLSGEAREYFKSLIPDSTSRWTYDMHWFRTLMHLPLYFLLGSIVYSSIHNILKSAGICLLISLVDETVKIFLPTREFGTVDVFFDIIGFMAGIMVAFLIRYFAKSIKSKEEYNT